ncbi:MAG: hypothetical protein A2138_23245 [Deltaproteobacteria bacterium RBG_16_71_12]|nr:MAG: hypothetical protein A2138_23245 [Deltaproteobacteria bacterium RBG_16_71_12]
MRALAVVLVSILGLAAGARAETGAALHLGIDVIKPVYGVPNLEVEVQIDKNMTAHVYGEMLAFETEMTPKGYSQAFARAGLRYFAWTFQETTRATGLFGGIGAGASMLTLDERPAPAVTAEVGYKLVLFDMLQLMPRVYATVPLDGAEPLPGLELMVGAVF